MTAIYLPSRPTTSRRPALQLASSPRAASRLGSVDHVAPQPRLRMTERGRRVLTALVAIPLVVIALAIALNSGAATATTDATTLTYVSVESGQTLWQLAQQVAPHADPRDVIAQIVSLNDLSSETITVGQSLAIPPQYAH